MKKLLAFTTLALSAVAAFAAGPYDGIYKLPNEDVYFSVHQNGNHVIAGSYRNNGAANWIITQDKTNLFIPAARWQVWAVFGGPIMGNVAVVEGEDGQGLCTFKLRLSFNGQSVLVENIGQARTPFAIQNGFPCGGRTNFEAPRVF